MLPMNRPYLSFLSFLFTSKQSKMSIWSELGGTVGDLGTYIPIVLALSLASHHDLSPPPLHPSPGIPDLFFCLGTGSDRHDTVSSVHLTFVMKQEEARQDHKHAAEAVEKKDEVVVPVKLGKFKSPAPTEGGAAVSGGCSANPDQDVRRCYSMGT